MTAANSDPADSIPETHNYTEAVGTRLTPKTRRRLKAYEEREEASTAEALRRVVRSGLDAEEEEPETFRERLGRAVFLGVLSGYPALAASQGSNGTAAVLVGTIFFGTLFAPLFSTAVDRIPNPLSWLE